PRALQRPRARRQTSADTRWHHAPPVQARSRETVDRLAGAAEELLRERSFEEIGVQDIARRARRPVGPVYARFARQGAPRPFPYPRYHEGLEPLLRARLARVPWARLGFEGTIEAVVELILGMYTERPWLIRALALFARLRPEALPQGLVEQRRRAYEPL